MGIESARQHGRLKHRDLMRARDFANLERHQIRALGNHLGRGHGGIVITQCHGIVGRVGDHKVGSGHGRDAGPVGDLALLLADLALELRVAFGLLVLLLDLLMTHLEARLEEKGLQRHIDQGHQQHHDQQQGDARGQPGAHHGERHGRWLGRNRCNLGNIGTHVLPGHEAQHDGQEHHLDHRGQLLLGEQILEARQGIELAKARLNGLEAEDPATCSHAGQHRGRGGHQREDHGNSKTQHQHGLKALQHQRRSPGCHGIEHQLLGHGLAQMIHHGLGAHQHQQSARAQNGQVRQIARARTLAVFTRLLQLAFGGGQVFVLGFGHGARTDSMSQLSESGAPAMRG